MHLAVLVGFQCMQLLQLQLHVNHKRYAKSINFQNGCFDQNLKCNCISVIMLTSLYFAWCKMVIHIQERMPGNELSSIHLATLAAVSRMLSITSACLPPKKNKKQKSSNPSRSMATGWWKCPTGFESHFPSSLTETALWNNQIDQERHTGCPKKTTQREDCCIAYWAIQQQRCTVNDRLTGRVVKASALRAADLDLIPTFPEWIFPGVIPVT